MTDNPEFNSARLLLRPLNIEDAQAMFNYRSDSVTNKFQGWIPKSLEEAEDFINNKVAPTINLPDTWFQMAVIEKASKHLIGDVGIHFLDEEQFQAEVGCTLGQQHHGKGFATEALRATIDFLFNELNKHRVVTSIDPENIKSIDLVERLGFRKEAHFRQSLLIDGEWVDDLVYAVLKDEWNNSN